MRKWIVTLRNPADAKTFVYTLKMHPSCGASEARERALRVYPRCIVLKLKSKE